MAIITLGTMAFDAIETPFGKTDKILVAPQPTLLMQQAINNAHSADFYNWLRFS